jgi:hypothetical protein
MAFSAKRSLYSDNPSDASHSEMLLMVKEL